MTEPTPDTEIAEELSTAVDDSQDPEAAEGTQDATGDAAEPETTFPAEYVRQLRREAAHGRPKARKAEEYARELFASRVAAMGKLADPTDLEFSEDLLTDHAALERAVDELLARKPHLAARTPRGDIGQGVTGDNGTVDLAALLRMGAN